jgi:hypothetical protein
MKRISKVSRMMAFSLLTSNIAYAQMNINAKTTKSEKSLIETTAKKVLSKFSFNYFAKYTGPSLSSDYQEGATYNRFDGGRDFKGQRRDTVGSKQTYQSFTLSYRLPKNMSLSYGITYQDNVQEDIKYKDSFGQENTRNYGRTFNDHRVSLFVPSIITGSKASLSSSFFYQLPTTQVSKDRQMDYALGIQPVLAINSNVRGLFHGLTASIEKNFYKRGYSYTDTTTTTKTYIKRNPDGSPWVNPDGSPMEVTETNTRINPVNNQGVLANIGGYINYMLTDKVTLKSSIEFDYNQVGEQVGTFNELGNNMDNIGNVGASYRLLSNMTLEAGVNFAIEDPSIEKTAVFTSLDIRI